jgi:hypothetical protein
LYWEFYLEGGMEEGVIPGIDAMTWKWVPETGAAKPPTAKPTAAQQQAAHAELSIMLPAIGWRKTKTEIEFPYATFALQSVIPIGNAALREGIYVGDEKFTFDGEYALTRDPTSGVLLRQTTPGLKGAGGGFDMSQTEEAHLEDYILMYLSGYAKQKLDSGAELAMGLYAMSPGEYLMLAGALRWMGETEAGQAYAKKWGVRIGVGVGVYVTLKKFGGGKMIKALLGGAMKKMRGLAGNLGRRSARRSARRSGGRVANEIVLGLSGEYAELARKRGAKYLKVPGPVWKSMTNEQRWLANREFLDIAISKGDDIILASRPSDLVEGGAGYMFRQELEYLGTKGYAPNAEETMMILVRGATP